MDQQESAQHGEIHEGGYGSPMPEDEMPTPGQEVQEATGGQKQEAGSGVERHGSGQPDGPEKAD